jgi:hypothetical protein
MTTELIASELAIACSLFAKERCIESLITRFAQILELLRQNKKMTIMSCM